MCDRAVGVEFTDSFLAVDCWEKCWSGTHLSLAVTAAVLLCLYTPLAVINRPYWQGLHHSLHIRGSVVGLLSKGLFQLTLITVFVCFRSSYSTVHAVFYLTASVLYTVLLFFIRTYNYDRLNLWEKLTMSGVCIYGVLGCIRTQSSLIPSEWLCGIIYITFSILYITGVVLQCVLHKYRSLLFRAKEDRYDIIKFAFTFGLTAQRHLQTFQNKRRISRVESSEQLCSNSNPQTPHRIPHINLHTQ